MLMTFLIAHAKGKETEELAAHCKSLDPASPTNAADGRRQSKAEFGMEHLLLGTGQLEDIDPQKLAAMKEKVQKTFDNRIYIVADPVSYAMGPLGTPNHDAKTLSMAQREEPTVEIRFFLENM